MLFVEDDEDIRVLYGAALREAGLLVEEAPTLAAALDSLGVTHPDVIVLDRELPDGDGFRALSALRVACTRACVPVVAFTASCERDARDVALAAGCTAFVRKPCPPDVLVRHVWDAIGAPSAPRLRVAGE